MSEIKECLVMIGKDFDPEWSEFKRMGIVSVAFNPGYDPADYIQLSFEEALQAQAGNKGANLVCGLVFTPVAIATGSSYGKSGTLVVSGEAYYVPELDPDQEPSTSSSD